MLQRKDGIASHHFLRNHNFLIYPLSAMTNHSHILSSLSQNKLFRQLSPEQLTALDTTGFRRQQSAAGAYIARQDEPADALFLIVTGAVAITQTLSDAHEADMAVRESGDFVGEMALLEGDIRSANMVCVQPTELIVIPKSAFLQILNQFPEINQMVIRAITQRLRQTLEQAGSQIEKNLELQALVKRITEQNWELNNLTKRLQTEIEARRQTEQALAEAQQHLEASQNAHRQAEIEKLGLFIGHSPEMQRVYEAIVKAAPLHLTVLIQGETGTGKELVALALHQLSSRRNRPFIIVNCGAIARDLAESELFGHVKGAFSGAVQTQPGKFKLADGSTLFLDEIGELPPDTQVKLLRAIEKQQIWPVGAVAAQALDVRIVAATHRDLAEDVKLGRFRADLFHRLNIIKIEVPPLRRRLADIPLLAYRFLRDYAAEMQRDVVGFSSAALDALQQHDWPGNVRELKHVIARAVFRHERGKMITLADLFPDHPQAALEELVNPAHPGAHSATLTLGAQLRHTEKKLLLAALTQNRGNRTKTAAQLGIDRKWLYRLIKKHQIAI